MFPPVLTKSKTKPTKDAADLFDLLARWSQGDWNHQCNRLWAGKWIWVHSTRLMGKWCKTSETAWRRSRKALWPVNLIALSCFTSLTCLPSITEGSSTWTGSLHRWALGSASSPPSKALHPPFIGPCRAPFYISLCGSKVGSANLSLPFALIPEPLLRRLCVTLLLPPVKTRTSGGADIAHISRPWRGTYPPQTSTLSSVFRFSWHFFEAFFISFLQVLCRLVKSRDKDKRLHHSFPSFQHSFN